MSYMIGTLATLGLEKQRKLIPAGSLCARFALGAFWSLLGAVISRGFLLAGSIVCARFLGKAGFGALGMIQSSVGMFGVLAGLGLGLTATKYVGQYRHTDRAKAGRILALSTTAALVSGFFMAVTLILFSRYLSKTVLGAPELAKPLAIAAGLVFFGALNGAQTGALAGLEAFKTMARINIGAGVLSFPLIVIGVWRGGLTGAVWGLIAALAVNWFLNNRALRSECSRMELSYVFASCRQELPILHQFSLPALLASIIVGVAMWTCNALLVHQPEGYPQLGLYTAADKWRLLILFVPTSVCSVALPVLSNMYGVGDSSGFRKVFRVNVLLNTGIAFVAALVIAAFAMPIMSMYGAPFRAGWPILSILAFTAVPEALNTILGQPLVAGHYMWWRFAFDVLLVGVLLGSAWLLIPKWNAMGLALAYAFSLSAAAFGLYVFGRTKLWVNQNHSTQMVVPNEHACEV
jgi:O-antigen/teichoic acid export membrane protein